MVALTQAIRRLGPPTDAKYHIEKHIDFSIVLRKLVREGDYVHQRSHGLQLHLPQKLKGA